MGKEGKMKLFQSVVLAAAVAFQIGVAAAGEGGHGGSAGTAPAQPAAAIKEMKGTICPVMGRPIKKQYNYVYKGTRYYFCCPGCLKMFKTDPEKYIRK